ncbi:hypothetical protein BJ875DRAFT_460697 [Amylocarpus encephaloides]|uniref:Large ribosomal subunit protein bL32m n=1 Tax=Amylocarpus encephaloides TaxID=45428 RepID=A0A9P8C633_9HELO|nr:hypothetical protein BJ875DRAFT_460697 [Amylocarpus encephaloides]
MTSAHVTTRSILSLFLPRLSAPSITATSRNSILYSRQLSHPLLPSIALALPASMQLNLPGIIDGLWESILRAVPKKRTSHMKQRSRRMAGKGLKDVTSLNKCSVCGNVKRAHLLCPHCVHEIRNFFKDSVSQYKTADKAALETKEPSKVMKTEATAIRGTESQGSTPTKDVEAAK